MCHYNEMQFSSNEWYIIHLCNNWGRLNRLYDQEITHPNIGEADKSGMNMIENNSNTASTNDLPRTEV